MSKQALLPCFKCGKELPNVFEQCNNQPSQGTAFHTGGHYGSTFFDPQDGQEIEINICDDCLNGNMAAIGWRQASRIITCGGVIVGRERLDNPLVIYTGQDGEHLETAIVPDKLGYPNHRVTWWTAQFEFARNCFTADAATEPLPDVTGKSNE